MKTEFPFGTQYYRAPTPVREDWHQDLKTIRDIGFNTIKLFPTWRWNNPDNGIYDFSDIDELMALAGGFGLSVILNVTLDAMPAWFYHLHPDCAMVTCDGRKVVPQVVGHRSTGGAPGPCYNHPEALRARMDFLAAITSRYAQHPALGIWDLWNEPELTCAILRDPILKDLACYCDHCRARFLDWLKDQYGNLERLNRRWHRNYRNWDDVELPRSGDAFSDMIDWRIFFSHVLAEELRHRVNTVKGIDNKTPVMVHTVPIPYFNAVTCCNNDFDLASQCDLFGNSAGSFPFAAAFNTSCADGKTVINSEIHAMGGSTYHRPRVPSFNDIKAHIFIPLARGIKGFIYWQYRPERLGLESPAWGLTAADGSVTPWLEYNRIICAALQKHAKTLLEIRPGPAEIALLISYKGQVFDWCASGRTDIYSNSLIGLFNALYDANQNSDILSADALTRAELQRYKVVLLPFPYYMEQRNADLLAEWVEAGGLLISEAFPGNVRGETGLHETTVPGLSLDRVFGVREGVVTSDLQEPPLIAAEIPEVEGRLQGSLFQEELVPSGATVLGRFANGSPAVTANRHGRGLAVLAGTLLGHAYRQDSEPGRSLRALLCSLIRRHGVRESVRVNAELIRVDLLTDAHGDAVLVINGSNRIKTEAEILLYELPGDKTEAVEISTGNRFPIERCADGWKLAMQVEPNHHEAYVLA